MPTQKKSIVSNREKRLRAKADSERFNRNKQAVLRYSRQLKQVARNVGSIIKTLAPNGEVIDLQAITKSLQDYAELLGPWAKAVGNQMVSEVAQRNEFAWNETARELGHNLKKEIKAAPTGKIMQDLLEEQVTLIKSIPLDAAIRVHKLTIEALSDSTRASAIAKEIQNSEHVSKSKAMLIARTETARVNAALTQSRAEFVGATHYIWRTAKDSDVRESHREMEGKIISYAEPPTLSDGTVTHAGAIYNCRCYQQPVLPDLD